MISPSHSLSQSGQWVSQHIFYHDFSSTRRIDRLLLDGVAPVVETLYDEEVIDGYFFIRYRERGPHIRLRLHAESEDRVHEVEERSRVLLTQYLERHPSPEVDWIDDVYTDPCPNNSVQTIAYEPETERYAGDRGIEIAERHFMHSSDTVLKALRRIRSADGSSGPRLSYALQLTAILILSAGFDRTVFPEFIADHLEHVIIVDFDEDAVDATFDRMRTTLLPQFERMIQLYETDDPADELTQTWVNATKQTAARLQAHLQHPSTPYSEVSASTGRLKKYLLVLQSYIHMTLNRLGVWGTSERFTLALLHRVATELSKSKSPERAA